MTTVQARAPKSRMPGYAPRGFRFGHERDGGGRRAAARGDRAGPAQRAVRADKVPPYDAAHHAAHKADAAWTAGGRSQPASDGGGGIGWGWQERAVGELGGHARWRGGVLGFLVT